MKKPVFFTYFFLIAFLVISCASKQVEERPLWADLETVGQVYNPSVYITAIGEGKSEEQAVSKSDAELASRFSKSVTAFTESSTHMTELDGKFTGSEKDLVQIVNVYTEYDISTVNHTRAYFDPVRKQYIVCAYLERKTEFKKYETKLALERKTYSNLFNQAVSEKDPIKKINLLKPLTEDGVNGDKYLSKLLFARFIFEEGASSYLQDLEKMASVPSLILQAKNEIIFYLFETAENKESVSALSRSLAKAGYASSTKNGTYSVIVTLNKNRTVLDEMVLLQPEITVEVLLGKESFYYNKTFEKLTSFIETESLIERKMNSMILDDLEKSFIPEFENTLEKLYN
ncbi:MAG: hypothetical protein MJ176_08625 [Treponema sp.]|nr:hypothetical protein [Treponema sp.]